MDEGLERLAAKFDAIYGQTYSETIPLVIKAAWSVQESEETVADIFEKMLDYLGDEDFLLAFRLLCRTYYPKYKDMVTEYDRYLDKMEKACLIDRVKRFNIVGKQVMTYVEKQYAVDTGFRMINTNLVNIEDTFFLENIIYNELISRDYEVFAGKTYKGEIDFVVIDGKKKCFIQVAYYLSGQQTIDREFGAFKPISDASPKYVLSMDRLDFSRDGISHINIVDFLLGKKELMLT